MEFVKCRLCGMSTDTKQYVIIVFNKLNNATNTFYICTKCYYSLVFGKS